MRKIDEVLERLEKIEDHLREGRYSDKLKLDQIQKLSRITESVTRFAKKH